MKWSRVRPALALRISWELLKPLIGKSRAANKALTAVLQQLIILHQTIMFEYLNARILPHVETRHALSVAVQTRTHVDINLKLFDLLGRVATTGLWYHWTEVRFRSAEERDTMVTSHLVDAMFKMIANNPILELPICDHQATDVALFLLLCLSCGEHRDEAEHWLGEMASRLDWAISTKGYYPTTKHEYRDLLAHPQNDEGYFEDATAGSTLIPLLACWLNALGCIEAAERLKKLVSEKLAHCTMQMWTADATSETHLYLDSDSHGVSFCELPIGSDDDILDVVREGCENDDGFKKLSANVTGFWPIILTACRHWRLPVPPNFWISLLSPDRAENVSDH